MKLPLKIAIFSLFLVVLSLSVPSKVAAQFCGDGFCDANEAGWCSDCTAKPFCGDGFCDANENPSSCASDCGCTAKFLDNYRCFGSDRQRQWLGSDCTASWATIESCQYGCSPGTVSCFYSQPPSAFDNSPTATISVPSSAAPNSQMYLTVTGTDDRDIAQLLLYNSNGNQIGTPSDCTGIQTICTTTFIVTAPSTFSTSYTFEARSMDSAGQLSSFVSGSGATAAAPEVPPVVPPVPSPSQITIVSVSAVSPASPLQAARFPLQSLFMRSVSFPYSDCVRPGESALLAVKVQNTGKTTLKDVSFTATVPEAGIYAKSGPVSITTKDKLTRFLRLDVPSDASEGDYYLRLTVSNSKFSRTVYRIFTVGSC